MEVFVTGASGFVGLAACRALVAAGHVVRAMSRREATDGTIQETGAQPIRCDLKGIRAEHVGSADAVLHCAAFVEAWGPRDAWYEGNVVGTQAVLDAARAAGARRFVHIGTEAALCRGQDLVHADESTPLAFDSPYPYCSTKAEAERRVREADGGGFTTIVLRPRFVWGPGDTTLLPGIERMATEGGWVWIDGGSARTSTTHIDNLVHAIGLALEKGQGGEAYFVLDDGAKSLEEMVSRMAATRGIELGERSIPRWLADAAGWLCETGWRVLPLPGEPPLTRHAAMLMSRDCLLDDTKARRELGYRPVIDVETGLAQLSA